MKLDICLYLCFRFHQHINVIKPT